MSRTISHRREFAPPDPETGAALILALVFMLITSLAVLGLLNWSGTNLSNIGAFEQTRTLNYSLNSAMETVIQEVRYSATACPSTGLQVPSLNSLTIVVYCSGGDPETETAAAASRVITFQACPSSVTQSACTTVTPGTYVAKRLTAQVTFDDFSPANPVASTQPCSTSCGAAMQINSWAFG